MTPLEEIVFSYSKAWVSSCPRMLSKTEIIRLNGKEESDNSEVLLTKNKIMANRNLKERAWKRNS
jgi:hypothetical protein